MNGSYLSLPFKSNEKLMNKNKKEDFFSLKAAALKNVTSRNKALIFLTKGILER